MNGNVDTRDAQLEAVRQAVLSEEELQVVDLMREGRWPEVNELVERKLGPFYAGHQPGGYRPGLSLRLLG